VCAEIGVWDGAFSTEILERTRPTKLHLIDPWIFQPRYRNSAFGRKAHIDKMDDKYPAVCAKFADESRVVIHRAMSHDALETFDDSSLDWVYIDGNHNYEVVSNDIRLCLQKVKPNGVICGDDLLWETGNDKPVRRAVREALSGLGDMVAFAKFGQQWRMQLSRG
jgi:hypothetical protein